MSWQLSVQLFAWIIIIHHYSCGSTKKPRYNFLVTLIHTSLASTFYPATRREALPAQMVSSLYLSLLLTDTVFTGGFSIYSKYFFARSVCHYWVDTGEDKSCAWPYIHWSSIAHWCYRSLLHQGIHSFPGGQIKFSLSRLNSGTDRRKYVIIRMWRVKKNQTSQTNKKKNLNKATNYINSKKSQYFLWLPHFYKLERNIQCHEILVNDLLSLTCY